MKKEGEEGVGRDEEEREGVGERGREKEGGGRKGGEFKLKMLLCKFMMYVTPCR